MNIKPLALAGLSLFLLGSCDDPTSESTSTGDSSTSVVESIPEDDKVHLIILAGASNARGKALNSDLSATDKAENELVQILNDGYRMENLGFVGDEPNNVRLQNVTSSLGDGTTEFGPEVGMAKVMGKRYGLTEYDEPRSAIVKYSACGSTFYDHWMSETSVQDASLNLNLDDVRTNPKLNQEVGPLTNNYYQLIDQAIDDYSALGYDVVIDGVVFLHGEQDAKFSANMEDYETVFTNFISDTRNYLNDEDLPFVIVESLTNSARYGNELRAIQKRVAEATNSIFVETSDLHVNNFEPWHFDAASTLELGKRVASELIALRDNREIAEVTEETIEITVGGAANLPSYLQVMFEDGEEEIVPVSSYEEFDDTTSGLKTTKVNFDYNGHHYDFDVEINVKETPFVDGDLSEVAYSDIQSFKIGEKVDVKLVSGDDGLYVAAEVKDDDISTDGEDWHNNDLGQMNVNDDLEIYLTDGDVSDRYSIMLSSANLLRVYDRGYDTTNVTSSMPNNNLVISDEATNFLHQVKTSGEMNDGISIGMAMELFISYEDLGITNTDNLKVLFEYNDVSLEGTTKTNSSSYYGASTINDSHELDLANYISVTELL